MKNIQVLHPPDKVTIETIITLGCRETEQRRGGNTACSEPNMLEYDWVKKGGFGRICRNLKMEGGKDILKIVVGSKCVRGGARTTRSGTLVVKDVLSCLDSDTDVGIDDSDCGTGFCQKGVLSRKYGGIVPSKECLLQGYHRCWDQPKDEVVVLPDC